MRVHKEGEAPAIVAATCESNSISDIFELNLPYVLPIIPSERAQIAAQAH